ncbi:MAG: hypothetical protein Unbinned4120contig1000_37 [Prokaryotic dsDNA virus sp.]|nr:MAG: hypothetical protein Unbinned4120contig1000_37 [Prokaryotic dsDNA virus sp.]
MTTPVPSTEDMIFVFGSNTGGIHGAGAALFARQQRGAKPGVGYGHIGQSYAIPTKGHFTQKLKGRGGHKRVHVGNTLDLTTIERYVRDFIKFAEEHPEMAFQVTRIGCGLAGLKDEDIAPMFEDAPPNCFFDNHWQPWLGKLSHRFWGNY